MSDWTREEQKKHSAEWTRQYEKGQQDERELIFELIRKDCEHPKFGERCFHDHLIEEITAQIEGINK